MAGSAYTGRSENVFFERMISARRTWGPRGWMTDAEIKESSRLDIYSSLKTMCKIYMQIDSIYVEKQVALGSVSVWVSPNSLLLPTPLPYKNVQATMQSSHRTWHRTFRCFEHPDPRYFYIRSVQSLARTSGSSSGPSLGAWVPNAGDVTLAD